MKTRIVPGLLLLSLSALMGCDKLCQSEVTDVARIHNLTGRELRLEVCKSTRGTQTIDVPAEQAGDFILGTRSAGYVKGGTSSFGSCDQAMGSHATLVALTNQDFTTVRFCRHDKDSTDITIVERLDPCPTGTLEQTTPIESCGD